MSKNCSSIFNVLLSQLLQRFHGKQIKEKVFFPTFHGLADVYALEFGKTRLSLVCHLQHDGQEFVMKIYPGHYPERYFATQSHQKKFSSKQYRQNDPCIIKLIHDCNSQKESWFETQIPLHYRNWELFLSQFLPSFVNIYTKARNGESVD